MAIEMMLIIAIPLWIVMILVNGKIIQEVRRIWEDNDSSMPRSVRDASSLVHEPSKNKEKI